MSNLKIGSQAIIIKANNPENIGKVVEVIDLTRVRMINVRKYNDEECGCYTNHGQDLMAVVCGENLLTKFEFSGYVQLNKISVIPVTWLMPLDGYQENTDDYEVIFNEIIQSNRRRCEKLFP